jgi:hypothetical protein
LNTDRWTLEVYRTVIETLQSIAWMLLVFFVAALIAYVVVRVLNCAARHLPVEVVMPDCTAERTHSQRRSVMLVLRPTHTHPVSAQGR